jgi:hypothetical protein
VDNSLSIKEAWDVHPMPAASRLAAAKAANKNEDWEDAGVPDAKDFKLAMLAHYSTLVKTGRAYYSCTSAMC